MTEEALLARLEALERRLADIERKSLPPIYQPPYMPQVIPNLTGAPWPPGKIEVTCAQADLTALPQN